MASDVLFSQIPRIIMKKVNATNNKIGPKSKKKLRFANDEDWKQDTIIQEDELGQNQPNNLQSGDRVLNSDENSSSGSIDVESIRDEPSSSSIERNFSDAIVQANMAPETRNQKVQTDESFITRPLSMSEYESHRNHYQAQFVTVCKPMFAIPKRAGREPPLKIGLTLPKGRKRKIYYPDEEEENIKAVR